MIDRRLTAAIAKAGEIAEDSISLQAAASVLPRELQRIGAQQLSEITAEGYPGRRFHSGTHAVDAIETLAISAARTLFHAEYANVQPLSCSNANLAVITSLLSPGDCILSLGLANGGHLTHGAPMSLVGRLYRIAHYPLSDTGWIDHDQVRSLAKIHAPKLIICGGSSYPRAINYQLFREIADEIGALLMADVSHVAGLVATGMVQSPIDHAHITTLSTYKQLFGPKGGIILSGKDSTMKINGRTLAEQLQAAVFPGFQGTPDFSQIALKAAALEHATTKSFSDLTSRIQTLANVLSNGLIEEGLEVLTHGTDTHMVVLDLTKHRVAGADVEMALETQGILTNRNLIPRDRRTARQTTGLRLGTNIVAYRQLPVDIILSLSRHIAAVISDLSSGHQPNSDLAKCVRTICRRYPLHG